MSFRVKHNSTLVTQSVIVPYFQWAATISISALADRYQRFSALGEVDPLLDADSHCKFALGGSFIGFALRIGQSAYYNDSFPRTLCCTINPLHVRK